VKFKRLKIIDLKNKELLIKTFGKRNLKNKKFKS